MTSNPPLAAISPQSGNASSVPKHARRFPAVLQISETDCGAACLAMILRYYRKSVSINRLRELAGTSRDGTSLHGLATAAEACGFSASPVRARTECLPNVALPAIVHWNGSHFMVLYEVGRKHVVLGDPSTGIRRVTHKEFLDGWTGYLLVQKPHRT